ncbi:MAG: glycosyl hydrolase, partial [Candidatus Daviesbacteria bacterium]|nr:glycosyl hydrolase [Candidatus Daviesbacteria bacterium]
MLIFGQEIKRRHFLILTSFLLILFAIPLSVYLVQKQQIFKSRAVTMVRPPSEFEVGLEAGEQSDTGKVNLVAESKAKWVRLNFIGDDWTASSSATKKYNQIIDAYKAKRINILGLIGAQSVAGGYDRTKPDDFIKKYVDAADAIVNRFGDRVKAYELFNEPNDWAGGTNAQVPPDLFAKYLGRIYRKIKIDQKKLDIILNSGPVFSHDQDTGASYLEQTYSAGKNLSDPEANWAKIKAETGSYPLDGIGYHIYVAQGMNDQRQVEPKIKENLNAFKSVITMLDPGKKIWISEFGWGTGTGRVTEEVQALNLEKAYTLLKGEPTVRMAMWFTLMDFDP